MVLERRIPGEAIPRVLPTYRRELRGSRQCLHMPARRHSRGIMFREGIGPTNGVNALACPATGGNLAPLSALRMSDILALLAPRVERTVSSCAVALRRFQDRVQTFGIWLLLRPPTTVSPANGAY